MPEHEHEHDRQLMHELREINRHLECICKELKCICKALQPPEATDFRLVQLKGEVPMAINGVQVGGTGVFQASLIPSNAAPLQSGPSFSTTDANVSLQPDSANPFNVSATVGSSETAASFDLTVSGTTTAGPITHTFTIPVIAAPPPQAVDFDLTQLS